jgi:hypothetical protein
LVSTNRILVKDFIFSFTNFCYLDFLGENYNSSENNIIIVEAAKIVGYQLKTSSITVRDTPIYAFVDLHKTLRPHFSTFQTNFVKDTDSLGTLFNVLVLCKHEPLGLPFLKHH